GLAFGHTWGALLLMTGAILGTSITFLISRTFGRAFAEQILRGKFKNFDDRLEKNGFFTILFFRLIPLVPYEVLNYAGGLSKIRFRDYFAATFLGIIPGVIISAYFGGTLGEIRGFKDLASVKFVIALAVLALAILAPIVYKRLKRKGGENA
ncbi:MAG: TVP38/TMEM64 family protein, partial [bacterium]|nr:TVP38/TMEM64 family protein [bacterium]